MGNLSVTMMAKELGNRWSSVEQDIKERYKAVAKEGTVRYSGAMELYTPSPEFLQKVEKAKGVEKKIKDPDAPKKPLRLIYISSISTYLYSKINVNYDKMF